MFDMARIRTIKPEFFTSESVCSVSPVARLLFIGLWCEADREGRLKWKPKTLKIRYLPVDQCDILDVSGELEAEGMINIYTANGVEYCEIPAFKSHQVINNREKESELPSRVSTRQPRVKAEGRKEGKGKEGKECRVNADEEFKILNPTDEQLKEIHRIRKANKGKPITERVAKTLSAEFKTMLDSGVSLDRVLDIWETKGWTSFEASWVLKNGFSQFQPQAAKPQLKNLMDQL